jgi:hypothetical protein
MPTSENITGEAQALALAVERRAQQAYEELLAKLDEGVDPRLAIAQVQKSFDGEFAGELAQAFSTVLQRSVSVGSVLAMPVGEVVLSRRLWALNGEMVNQVSGLIRQHAQGLQSAQTLARQLYDGYTPVDGVQRPLEGAARAKLPKALQALTSTPQTRESLARVLEQGQQLAARIKSETLKAGYLEAVQAWVDGEGKQALAKRLWVAQREKNRYTADRIAQTELARAHQSKVGAEFMADGSISVVQVRINPAHPVTDICDLHARADLFGLGAGCYPKAKAPRPPFHPHCACRLSSRPDLMAGADTAERKGAVQAYLKSLPAYEAARVMGSRERLLDVMQRGKSVDAVVNAGRDPMYHLARLGGMDNLAMKIHPQALPNVENVAIPMEKITGYALDRNHIVGANKARVFESALGFTQANAKELSDQIGSQIALNPAIERDATEYGRVFSVDVPVVGPRGKGVVSTGWILKTGEETPRLTSLRVVKGKK